MLELLILSVIIAAISSFIILLIEKIGIRNKIVEKAPMLISQLFSCDFCLSFWFSLILAIILAIIFSNISIILTPFISTPIARILI